MKVTKCYYLFNLYWLNVLIGRTLLKRIKARIVYFDNSGSSNYALNVKTFYKSKELRKNGMRAKQRVKRVIKEIVLYYTNITGF